jgi:FkbM family methyltransferase
MSPKNLYQMLLKRPFLRKKLRRMRAVLQGVAGYSDPHYDLVAIANSFPSALFLDIGCHHGDTLLRFFESGLRTPVVAFDPFPKNLDVARQTLSAYRNISFTKAAISDCDGDADFFVNQNEQTSSLLENDEGNQTSFPEDTTRIDCITVPTVRLDTWIRSQPDKGIKLVVKCDTQGAEGKVISGALDAIRNNVVAFYGEVMLGKMYKGQATFDEIRNLLEGPGGMVLKQIYPCLHDASGRAVQLDALWIKPDMIELTK